jgi:hypothetical protein
MPPTSNFGDPLVSREAIETALEVALVCLVLHSATVQPLLDLMIPVPLEVQGCIPWKKEAIVSFFRGGQCCSMCQCAWSHFLLSHFPLFDRPLPVVLPLYLVSRAVQLPHVCCSSSCMMQAWWMRCQRMCRWELLAQCHSMPVHAHTSGRGTVLTMC